MNADRNLLFGILALQNDFVSRDQLVEAMHAWVLEKQTPLGDILTRRGALAEDVFVLLDALVEKQISKHSGDVQASIAALSSVSKARSALESINDQQVQTTLRTLSMSANIGVPGTEQLSGKSASDPGRFTILRPHAAGGLGEVFVARDNELNREVALKQIKGEYSDNMPQQSRFVLEAEITGGLEHPGIVPVYSLGHYGNGRPYYAMRFIRGDSLKDAIGDFHQRVEELAPTIDLAECDSDGATKRVNLASTKDQVVAGTRAPTQDFSSLEFRSLVRRLIDVCNAIAYAHSRGVLHRDLKPGNVMLGKYGETMVVDWGLAKALGKTAVEEPATLGLLMPTSGNGTGGETDQTRPGSVLGTPAYMSPEQAEGGMDELGPATDVYSLGATLFTILTGKPAFTGNAIEILEKVRLGIFPRPHTLKAGVPKALDAICCKSMARSPTDRYANPQELAIDLERWLADEPIPIYREPAAIRCRRFLRRRAALAAGVAASVTVALVGLALGLAVVGVKNRALDGALARETEERRKAEASEALAKSNELLAKTNEQKAEAEFRRAKTAIDDYFTAVSQSQELKIKFPGMREFRIKLLNKAEEYYKDFLSERGNDPHLQAEAAKAFFNRAQVANEIGRTADARVSYEASLAIWEKLARDNPEVTEYASSAATLHNNLGRLLQTTGNGKAALANYKKSLAVREKLARENPTVTDYANRLAGSHNNLGALLSETGDTKAALTNYAKALAIREELARANPKVNEYASDLARTLDNLGRIQERTGDAKAAMSSYAKALTIQEKLVRDNPTVTDYASSLARIHNSMAKLQSESHDSKAALASCIRALSIQEKLLRDNPTVTEYALGLARSHHNLGVLQTESGDSNAALANYAKALAIHEKLVRENPTVTEYASALAASHNSLGGLYRESGNFKAALASYNSSLAIAEKLARDNPTVIKYASALAGLHNNLGALLGQTGDTKLALESWAKALAIAESLARNNPKVIEYAVLVGTMHRNMGIMIRNSSSPQEALAHFQMAIAVLAGPARVSATGRTGLRDTHLARARTLVKLDRIDEAVSDFDAAIKSAAGARSKEILAERAEALAKKSPPSNAIAPAPKSTNDRKGGDARPTEKEAAAKKGS